MPPKSLRLIKQKLRGENGQITRQTINQFMDTVSKQFNLIPSIQDVSLHYGTASYWDNLLYDDNDSISLQNWQKHINELMDETIANENKEKLPVRLRDYAKRIVIEHYWEPASATHTMIFLPETANAETLDGYVKLSEEEVGYVDRNELIDECKKGCAVQQKQWCFFTSICSNNVPALFANLYVYCCLDQFKDRQSPVI